MADQTILVTGANVGLGFDTCRQVAKLGAAKVILACRNVAKAEAAIEKLVKLTGKPASTFDVLQMDTGSLSSCKEAAASVDTPLDAVVLNAGGILYKNGSAMNKAGAHNQFTVNVLGHAVFVEELIKHNRLNKGAHIMFSGSEATRGITAMGFKGSKFEEPIKQDMINHMTAAKYKKYDPMVAYGYTKTIGQLYFAKLAKENPDLIINSVSPGATNGTSGTSEMPVVMRVAFRVMMGSLMKLSGNAHSLSNGSERYLSGIGLGPVEVPSGSFFASPKGKSSGKLVDQGKIYPIFTDADKMEAAYEAVQSLMK
mmetsp:Transcript_4265/g.4949  ORF Transcript_4265/g.4949 Transcript_4265/m.4949 type:complete len:312 (+) Transcript_4265:142-1077(+)|eukprot:CAMPEP_0184020474 /NCGR_PEP_ID=MMETSP0954-20121128/9369_1 /TAXON_ID=627963 /ORGANISM="Aplanochytrium sp, Strain PBS07" /LENGTH=311 /DNA_ID=CAMNT_0026302339 /DNA_START=186 /DNA_END=1121 /DNA_ORIENTATION=+